MSIGPSLAKDTIGHSTLERFPVAHRDGKFIFLLPTATSAAIRRYAFEQLHSLGLREALTASLAEEYSRLFSETPLLGERRGAPIQFQKTEDGLIAGVTRRIDNGLYLNLVFFVDNLKGFETTGAYWNES